MNQNVLSPIEVDAVMYVVVRSQPVHKRTAAIL